MWQANEHVIAYYDYLVSVGKAPYWYDKVAMHCEGSL